MLKKRSQPQTERSNKTWTRKMNEFYVFGGIFLSFVTNWKLRGGKDRCVSHGTVRWQEYKVFKTYWRCHWYFFLVEVFIRFVRWQYWHWHIMFIVYEVFIEKWRKETLLAIFFSLEKEERQHMCHIHQRDSHRQIVDQWLLYHIVCAAQ